MEQKFYAYDWWLTTRGGNAFFPMLVREFYANYLHHLENRSIEGERSVDKSLLDKGMVWGIMVDVFETIINRFLPGPNYTPHANSPTFYARLKHQENQRNCLATLIVDGEPEWLTNPGERIFKASLTVTEKFWWGIIRSGLIPRDGDNTLEVTEQY